jgi:hypothetical protein
MTGVPSFARAAFAKANPATGALGVTTSAQPIGGDE